MPLKKGRQSPPYLFGFHISMYLRTIGLSKSVTADLHDF